MLKYKVVFTLPDGEQEEIMEEYSYEAKLFNSEEDAEDAAREYIDDSVYGSEIMHLSNPGDYDIYSPEDYEYVIVEVDV